jgi:hypothetical protein
MVLKQQRRVFEQALFARRRKVEQNVGGRKEPGKSGHDRGAGRLAQRWRERKAHQSSSGKNHLGRPLKFWILSSIIATSKLGNTVVAALQHRLTSAPEIGSKTHRPGRRLPPRAAAGRPQARAGAPIR